MFLHFLLPLRIGPYMLPLEAWFLPFCLRTLEVLIGFSSMKMGDIKLVGGV